MPPFNFSNPRSAARLFAHNIYPKLRFIRRNEFRSVVSPLCASGVAIVGIAFFSEPIRAKTAETRQEVYVWGRAQCIPGGAASDVLWPKRVTWFEEHGSKKWSKIAFGADMGVALDTDGHVFLWGNGTAPGEHIGPIEVIVEGDGKGMRLVDVQLSSTKLYALTSKGHALVFSDLKGAWERRSPPPSSTEVPEADGSSPTDSAEQVVPPALLLRESSTEPIRLQATLLPGLPKPGNFGWLFGRSGVKQMSIGLEHAAFVTFRGDLYCVGGNEWGQCGVAPPRQKGPMGALEDRYRVEVEEPVRVQLPESAAQIVQVAVGGRHTIAQDSEGRCYSFGDDRRIQLGLGDTRTGGHDERHSYGVLHSDALGGKRLKGEIKRVVTYRYYDPHFQSKPVETLPPEASNRPPYPAPSLLACGEDFTMAVHRDSPDWYSEADETNVIMCCGENGSGQCGRSLHQQQQVWSGVRLHRHCKTKALACGQSHCLALLRTGEVYSWGSNPQGQVGNGKRSLVPRPMRVTQAPLLPPSMKMPENSPATLTLYDLYKQAVYRHAATGGSEQDAPVPPITVHLPGTVSFISCGFRNSAVVCEVPIDESS